MQSAQGHKEQDSPITLSKEAERFVGKSCNACNQTTSALVDEELAVQ
jgi:hypothetical protein